MVTARMQCQVMVEYLELNSVVFDLLHLIKMISFV